MDEILVAEGDSCDGLELIFVHSRYVPLTYQKEEEELLYRNIRFIEKEEETFVGLPDKGAF